MPSLGSPTKSTGLHTGPSLVSALPSHAPAAQLLTDDRDKWLALVMKPPELRPCWLPQQLLWWLTAAAVGGTGCGAAPSGGGSGPPTGVPHTQPGCSCGHWEGGGTGTRGPKELGLTAMGGRGWCDTCCSCAEAELE